MEDKHMFFKKGDTVPDWYPKPQYDGLESVEFGMDVRILKKDNTYHTFPMKEHKDWDISDCLIKCKGVAKSKITYEPAGLEAFYYHNPIEKVKINFE